VLSWSELHRALAASFRVVSYDRAGLGWSDLGPMPRTADRIVDELHALLQRAFIPPPYVLVGHSFGGLTMPLFAARFPGEVAGMVLVDPVAPAEWNPPSDYDLKQTRIGAKVCRRAAVLARLGLIRFVAVLLTTGLKTVGAHLVRLISRGSPAESGTVSSPWFAALPANEKAMASIFWIQPKFALTIASQLENLPASAASVGRLANISDKPVVILFVDSAKPEQLQIVRDVAKQYKGKVVTTYGPLPAQKALAERWGASGNLLPTAILADWKHSSNPVMTVFNEETEKAGLTTEAAVRFVEQALADKYESYLKSEPIPANNNAPVQVLVGKTIEQTIKDPSKDVFVEFYAPWCGHCKKLTPVWDELAETLSGVDHIKIAKIDATANNLPKSVNVRGYPTLIFYPVNNKVDGIPYNGERDLESLTKFVVEQSSKPVKISKDEL